MVAVPLPLIVTVFPETVATARFVLTKATLRFVDWLLSLLNEEALRSKVGDKTVLFGMAANTMCWSFRGAFVMLRIWNVSAGHQLPSPDCFAVNFTSPVALSAELTVTFPLAATEARAVLLLSKVTGRPELDSAESVKGALSGVLSGIGWNTISCAPPKVG